jgi:hypothetical protein
MAVLDESANEVKCAPNSSFVIGECLKIFDEVETREEYEQANVSNNMRLYSWRLRVLFLDVDLSAIKYLWEGAWLYGCQF